MENKDKIYDQFKEAATKAEDKGFARMDAVWNRVEEKLDQKKERRAAIWWKYTGIAALLLLFTGIGAYLMNNNDAVITPQALPQHNVTVTDTIKVKETVAPITKQTVTKKPEQVIVSAEKPKAKNAPVIDKTKPVIESSADAAIVAAPSVNNTSAYNTASSEVMEAMAKEKYPVAETPQTEIVLTPAVATINAEGKMVYSGIVYDSSKMPIPGVNVTLKGLTTKGVQTDYDGKYQIDANPGDILQFSFIGMESQEIRISRNTTIDIAMADDSNTLEEVVVVGYGTLKKSDVTGAVTTVNRELSRKERRKQEKEAKAAMQQGVAAASMGDINTGYGYSAPSTELKSYKGKNENLAKSNTSVNNSLAVGVDAKAIQDTNITQALQGQVAGLQITPNNGASEYYNTVSIRGVGSIQTGNKPLYVIDGKIASEDALRNIDPNKIEHIEVLKDNAATSLYGSRASNGVIIIKTKNLSRKEKRAIKKAAKEALKTGYIDTTSGKSLTPEKIQVDSEEYEAFEENKFENPATTPLSTFSIDVDNASYTNVRRFLNGGQTVPKDAVRVEEMINFFKYSYPQPKGNDPFSVNTEYSDAPWNPKHKLLKIGLQGKEIASKDLPASNFVFLIDVSGSMSDSNKLPLLKQSMKILVSQMRKQDRIAIVVYAGAAGLVLPSTSGDEKETIIAALDKLNAGGSTAGGAGIELAYKTAQENFVKGGNNRIILATDGDFNVGASSNTDMQTLIEEKRKSGVFLTCLGYGMGNYKDSKLETLADKGNGNYAYIDNMQEADRFLDKEFKGSMYALAKDVKIQIEFNPKHVQSYRLIGYENRKLRDEDFANDAIDAGELGSGHTVTALYEIIPTGVQSDYFAPTSELKYSQPNAATGTYNNELATIKLRHKKPEGDKSTETVTVVPNSAVSLEQASADFKFAASVAWFGLKLRDSKLLPNKQTKDIYELAKPCLLYDPEGYRAEFLRLIQMVE
ncbi:VWA domain-containing protein [Flavobacterium sp. Sd200]|uniref:YfbK domain-containing protein n=1 Tax=Flavobacterium sp. Sd200 TaxID=2692211 RepID=UPI00136EAF6A